MWLAQVSSCLKAKTLCNSFSAANKYYCSAGHHEQKNKKPPVKLNFCSHNKTINKTSLMTFSL